jgi:hypothetical protein
MNPKTGLILNVITIVIFVLVAGFIGGACFESHKLREQKSWAETSINRDAPGWVYNEAIKAVEYRQ